MSAVAENRADNHDSPFPNDLRTLSPSVTPWRDLARLFAVALRSPRVSLDQANAAPPGHLLSETVVTQHGAQVCACLVDGDLALRWP